MHITIIYCPLANAGETALKGKSDADIARVIKEGGKVVGKSATMPASGSKLTDDQTKAVVDYVKGLGK